MSSHLVGCGVVLRLSKMEEVCLPVFFVFAISPSFCGDTSGREYRYLDYCGNMQSRRGERCFAGWCEVLQLPVYCVVSMREHMAMRSR